VVAVKFAPTAANVGKDPATLSINSNTPKHPQAEVHISGTGAGGKLSVPASVSVSTGLRPTTVGSVATKTLNIKNSGLGLLNVTVGGTGVLPPFSVTPASGTFPLTHLQILQLTITFTPTAKGLVTAPLGITTDDPNPKHDNVTVTLKGTGALPKVK
jgi:hypothetical protein